VKRSIFEVVSVLGDPWGLRRLERAAAFAIKRRARRPRGHSPAAAAAGAEEKERENDVRVAGGGLTCMYLVRPAGRPVGQCYGRRAAPRSLPTS